MSSPTPIAPGACIGRWTIQTLLGSGGFGSTWRVRRDDGRIGAIKLLEQAPGNELRALSRLCHPGIVQLLDSGVVPQPYLVMELARGEALHKLLERGPLSTEQAAGIAVTLFSALATVHHAGLTHGDVKPANLVVRLDPLQVRLVDFGLAGGSGGTAVYAAPELIRGQGNQAASDVYTAGLVLWEMLHGERPWASLSIGDLLARRLVERPEPSAGPPWLRKLLCSALAINPTHRPTAAAIADALAAHGFSAPEPGIELIRQRLRTAYVPRPEVDFQLACWLEEGGDLLISGSKGSGRSRLIQRVGVELSARGRQPLVLVSDGIAWSAIVSAARRLMPKADLAIPEGPDVHIRVERTTRWLVELIGARPVLLVDDIDTLDDASAMVVRSLRDQGLADILATTSTLSPSSAESSCQLLPLTEQGIREMIRQSLGESAVITALAHHMLEHSSGVPAAAVDYLLAAVDAGVLRQRSSTWLWDAARLPKLVLYDGGFPLPLYPVDSPAGRICAVVALLEPSTPADALPQITGLAPEVIEAQIDDLIAAGLVYQEQGHIHCVDSSTSRAIRRQSETPALHAALVAWLKQQVPLEADRLVAHALAAGDLETAREAAMPAMEQLLARDPVQAAALSDALWDVVSDPEIAWMRIRALSAGGRVDEARRFGTALLDDEALSNSIDICIELAGLCANHDPQPEAALAWLERADKLLGDAPATDRIELTRAQVFFQCGHLDRAIEAAARITAKPPPEEHAGLERWLTARYMWAQAIHQAGDLESALAALESVPDDLGWGLSGRALLSAALGRLLWFAGRLKEADWALTRAAQQDAGLPLLDRARLLNNLGAVRHHSGDRAGAVQVWEQGLGLFERLDAPIEIGRVQVNLCLGYKELGRWERARQAGLAAEEGAGRLNAPDLAGLAAANMGELEMEQGNLDLAETHFRLARRFALQTGSARERIEADCRLAELSIMHLSPAGLAEAQAVESDARAENMILEASQAAGLVAVGLARLGAPIEEAIERAIRPLQDAGAAADLARVRLWVAEAYLAADRASEAANEVARVRLYAREVNNQPLVIRADALEERIAARSNVSHRDQLLERMVELAVSINDETDLSATLQGIARAGLDLLMGDRAFVLMGNPPTVASSCFRVEGDRGMPSMSVVEQALERDREVIVVDLDERGDLRQQESILALDLRSVLCVPMKHHSETIGAIYVDSRSSSQESLHEVAHLMRGLAALAAAAVVKMRYFNEALVQARKATQLAERQRAQSTLARLAEQLAEKNAQLQKLNVQLQRSAVTDALTSIPNRRHLVEVLEKRHREPRAGRYGLILLDIDHFKRFNDTYGHQIGDKALVQVAHTIHQSLRDGDQVFRYGGEEMVVLTFAHTEQALHTLCERIRVLVRSYPIAVRPGEHEIITISLGAALFTAQQDVDWYEMIRRADTALYVAKDSGRDCTRMWNDSMNGAKESAA